MTIRADFHGFPAAVFLRRAALLALLWWILTEGRFDAALFATALVCAAAGASLALQPPPRPRRRWRPAYLPRLTFYFLRLSLLGGWDVARRAFTPSLPVQPALVRFELELEAGFPLVLFTWLVSLTPGTASVTIEGRVLVVHALDVRLAVEEKLRELELQVAALFRK